MLIFISILYPLKIFLLELLHRKVFPENELYKLHVM